MLSVNSAGEMESFTYSSEVVGGADQKVEVGVISGQELANLVTLVRVKGYLEVNCGMTHQEVRTI